MRLFKPPQLKITAYSFFGERLSEKITFFPSLLLITFIIDQQDSLCFSVIHQSKEKATISFTWIYLTWTDHGLAFTQFFWKWIIL